jgi:ABC-type antimicrobial peptide transport system permease subunit
MVGALAGYYGRLADAALMRFTDVALSVPPLPLIIVLSAVVKPSPQILVLIIAGVGWMGTARLVRSAFLTIRETEYVEAARAAGCGSLRIILRHALPNSLAPVIVAGSLAVGNAVHDGDQAVALGLPGRAHSIERAERQRPRRRPAGCDGRAGEGIGGGGRPPPSQRERRP